MTASDNFKSYMDETKRWFEKDLTGYLDRADIPEKLKRSMLYSLTAGGKRIRPILLFATLEALGKDPRSGFAVAVALEMIHTYSLIHDDLPAMDDDDLRRGRPTNHKIFGEGTAVLAGDGLLTAAFQILADKQDLGDRTKVRLLSMLAQAAGPEGMVGGQEDDLEAEEKVLNLEELRSIHRRKTGKLIQFPIDAAALLAGADERQKRALSCFGARLGLAFQIGDDVLDIVGSEQEIGKPVGSDLTNHKNTYVSLLTVEGAMDELEKQVQAAIDCLESINLQNGTLAALAIYLLRRTR